MVRVSPPAAARPRRRWHQSHERTCAEVLARLRAQGPLNSTQLGGAKAGGPWWDWSDTKIAVEWLLDVGEVVAFAGTAGAGSMTCPSGCSPASCSTPRRPTRSAWLTWPGWPARALGVVTRADLIDYHRLRELTNGQAGHADWPPIRRWPPGWPGHHRGGRQAGARLG